MRGVVDRLDPVFADVLFQLHAAASHSFVVSKVPCALLTVHGGSAYSSMSPTRQVEGYRIVLARLAEHRRVSNADVRALRGHFTEYLRRMATVGMRKSFLAGDWFAFEEAVRVAERSGGARRKSERVLKMLAYRHSRSSLVFRIARFVLKLRQGLKDARRRRHRPLPAPLESVLCRCAGLAEEKERTLARGKPMGA
jgi:hypothetical protein